METDVCYYVHKGPSLNLEEVESMDLRNVRNMVHHSNRIHIRLLQAYNHYCYWLSKIPTLCLRHPQSHFQCLTN